MDSALLYAGAIVAGSRFGGLVDGAVTELLLAADWSKFVLTDEVSGFPSGYLSLAWEPDNEAEPTGSGELMPFAWVDAMDEERLTRIFGPNTIGPNKKHQPQSLVVAPTPDWHHTRR